MYQTISDKFPVILSICVLLRLASVIISVINEKKLRLLGAIEYGKLNSLLLVLAHFVFYGACLIEGKACFLKLDRFAILGLVLYSFAIGILYYVIAEIRHVWTVKLIIAPLHYHVVNKSLLFRYLKHPNYYLSIIPELLGFALIFHAWHTILIGFPLYAIILIVRIRLEESIMKKAFPNY
jgi:isoprenylcysteine carboxyl methyltransferase (ICMT) family protein YpbQ